MSISDRLDQIEARADAATEGPWEKRTVNGWEMVVSYSTDAMIQLVAEFRHKERDLNDAEFIAASRTDVPALVAALRSVLDLHEAVPVYQIRDEFGGFATNDDGERILIATLCRECSSDEAIESVEDQEWDEGWAPEVSHPCPTYRTVTAALGEGS